MIEDLMIAFIYGTAIFGFIAGIGLIFVALRNDK